MPKLRTNQPCPQGPIRKTYGSIWRLENNDERLVLIFPLDEAFYKIVSISDTEMILDHLKQGSYALDGYRTILQR